MKYYTLGTMFLFFSLITILILLYYSSLTKPVEKNIQEIQSQIDLLYDRIKVNELEYSAHIHPDYLESLEKIYLFDKYINKKNQKIVGIKEFDSKNLSAVIKVTSN